MEESLFRKNGFDIFWGTGNRKTDQNEKKQTKNRPKISKSLLTDQSLLKQTVLASLEGTLSFNYITGY